MNEKMNELALIDPILLHQHIYLHTCMMFCYLINCKVLLLIEIVNVFFS